MPEKDDEAGQGLVSAIGPDSMVKYEPLETSKSEIRLLCVEPGAASDIVTCYLHHISLQEPPSYLALSYTWGDQEKRKDICLNGAKISITAELESTLAQLRQTDTSIEIWIDALCICQKDNKEKSFQVRLMQEIYSNASEVIIWLGESSNDSDLAFELLKRLPSIQFNDSKGKDLDKYYMASAWWPLNALLSRRWWSRVWCIQELVVATRASVWCGRRSIPWDNFRHLANEVTCRISNRSGASVPVIEQLLIMAESPDLQILAQMRDMRQSGKALPLYDLLRTTASKGSTNPRDRIYALLGIANSRDREALIPDYDKSVAEVLMDTTRHLVLSPPFLDTLQLGEVRPNLNDLPSWCVDYSAPENEVGARPLISGLCPSPTGQEPRWSPDLRTMTISGFQIGRVTYASAYTRANLEKSKDDFGTLQPPLMLKTWYRTLRRTASAKKLYATSGGRLDALCRTLIAGQKVLRSDRERSASAGEAALTRPELLAAFEAWLKTPAPEALRGELDSSHGPTVIKLTIPSEMIGLVTSYRGTAIRYLRGRAFFTTREGFIGLAPASAREGDYVCLAHGASTPIVLRELDGATFCWVGAAYVHGIMKGEMWEWLKPKEAPKEFPVY